MYKARLTKEVALAVLAAAAGAGQVVITPGQPGPDAHGQKVIANTERIKLEVTLDHDTYLRGEAMRITLAAWNPTNETLEVLDPFKETVPDFGQWGEGKGFPHPVLHYRELASEPPTELDVPWWGPTITMSPGQRIEKSEVDNGGSPGYADLRKSNKFMLCYGYIGILGSCAQAPFEVEPTTVVYTTAAKFDTPERVTNPATSAVEEIPRFVHAMVLQADGKRYVVVSRRWTRGPEEYVHPGQELDIGGLGSITPYDRVAEVSMAVSAIRLEADQDDNVIVHWQDETGAPHAVLLDKGRTTMRTLQ